MIRNALNQQTAIQFRAYAEQHFPGNKAEVLLKFPQWTVIWQLVIAMLVVVVLVVRSKNVNFVFKQIILPDQTWNLYKWYWELLQVVTADLCVVPAWTSTAPRPLIEVLKWLAKPSGIGCLTTSIWTVQPFLAWFSQILVDLSVSLWFHCLWSGALLMGFS